MDLVPERNPVEIVGERDLGEEKARNTAGESAEGAMEVDVQDGALLGQNQGQGKTTDANSEVAGGAEEDKILRQLHTLLLETEVDEGKLACARCGFEYPIKEGVGNFLLPAHLGEFKLPHLPRDCPAYELICMLTPGLL